MSLKADITTNQLAEKNGIIGRAFDDVQGWRNQEGPGDRSPGPQKFHLLGGTKRDPVFLKVGPFD